MGSSESTVPKQDPKSIILRHTSDITAQSPMSFMIKQADKTSVSFTKLSKVSQVHVLPYQHDKALPHFGLIFENEFLIGKAKHSYRFLLVHALAKKEDPKKMKLDLLFTDDENVAKARLAQLVGKHYSDVVCTPYQTVSHKANMFVLVDLFHSLMSNVFDMRAEVKMAFQEYGDRINCVLAAKHLYAAVMDLDRKLFLEEWINEHRGLLLNRAALHVEELDEKQGIPCKGGDVFWSTLQERTVQCGTLRLQKHKTKAEIKDLTQQQQRGYIQDAVVHNMRFRIIVNRNKNHAHYQWRDIYRDDDENKVTQQFNTYVKNQRI